jgi:hypothetical protein
VEAQFGCVRKKRYIAGMVEVAGLVAPECRVDDVLLALDMRCGLVDGLLLVFV